MTKETIFLNALGIINPLGNSKSLVAENLFAGRQQNMVLRSGLRLGDDVVVGEVPYTLPSLIDIAPTYASRSNAMLQAALNQIDEDIQQAIEVYGSDRIGVIMGTSTSGIAEGEKDVASKVREGHLPEDFHYARQAMGNPALYVADRYGLQGPAYCVSTACTSGAKAMAAARRMLRAGLVDVVLAGGVDTLSQLTVNGFGALEALSSGLCNPFSVHRDGINIGEGAAVFLMSREEAPLCLAGIGESSDAHHMSAPDPRGQGAMLAMRKALEDASIEPDQVDYVNLHGTATPLNDSMEALAVSTVLGSDVLCSSTKPLTGHMLGAAGSNEAAFLWLSLLPEYGQGRLPPHLWDGQADPDLAKLEWVKTGCLLDRPACYAMSNSFAFGGNNISLILGRTGEVA